MVDIRTALQYSGAEEERMGYYVNPPEALSEIGRSLHVDADEPAAYDQLVSRLRADELLFGLYDRGAFMNGVCLYSQPEFDEFERQVRSRAITRIGFYAVKREVAERIIGESPPEQSRATA